MQAQQPSYLNEGYAVVCEMRESAALLSHVMPLAAHRVSLLQLLLALPGLRLDTHMLRINLCCGCAHPRHPSNDMLQTLECSIVTVPVFPIHAERH